MYYLTNDNIATMRDTPQTLIIYFDLHKTVFIDKVVLQILNEYVGVLYISRIKI